MFVAHKGSSRASDPLDVLREKIVKDSTALEYLGSKIGALSATLPLILDGQIKSVVDGLVVDFRTLYDMVSAQILCDARNYMEQQKSVDGKIPMLFVIFLQSHVALQDAEDITQMLSELIPCDIGFAKFNMPPSSLMPLSTEGELRANNSLELKYGVPLSYPSVLARRNETLSPECQAQEKLNTFDFAGWIGPVASFQIKKFYSGLEKNAFYWCYFQDGVLDLSREAMKVDDPPVSDVFYWNFGKNGGLRDEILGTLEKIRLPEGIRYVPPYGHNNMSSVKRQKT